MEGFCADILSPAVQVMDLVDHCFRLVKQNYILTHMEPSSPFELISYLRGQRWEEAVDLDIKLPSSPAVQMMN